MKYIFEVRIREGYQAEDYADAWVRASALIQQAPGARVFVAPRPGFHQECHEGQGAGVESTFGVAAQHRGRDSDGTAGNVYARNRVCRKSWVPSDRSSGRRARCDARGSWWVDRDQHHRGDRDLRWLAALPVWRKCLDLFVSADGQPHRGRLVFSVHFCSRRS